MKKPVNETTWPYNLIKDILDMDNQDVRWYDVHDDSCVRLIGLLMPLSEEFEAGKKGTGERNLSILLDKYQNNLPNKEISEKHNVHKQTVSRVLSSWLTLFREKKYKSRLLRIF